MFLILKLEVVTNLMFPTGYLKEDKTVKNLHANMASRREKNAHWTVVKKN